MIKRLAIIAIISVVLPVTGYCAGGDTIAPPPQMGRVIHWFLYFIFALYLIQALFAYAKASSSIPGLPHSMLHWLLMTGKGLNSFWTFFVIAVILSIGIPLAQEVAGPQSVALSEDAKTSDVAYHLTTGCLLVFITLEVSCLYDMLQTTTFDWLALLLVSLVIDVIAFFLLSNAGIPSESKTLLPNSYTTKYLILTTLTSLVSSASTILFARTQGILKHPKQKNPK